MTPGQAPPTNLLSELVNTFASSAKLERVGALLWTLTAASRAVGQVNTMGKIEWAMWANEQALASGLSE